MTQVASNAHRVEVIAGGGNALVSLAQTMGAGTWAALPTLKFIDPTVTLGNVLKGFPGNATDYVLQYANTCTWDPLNQSVVFLGAKHVSVVGPDEQATRFLRYKLATNMWENNFDGTLPHPRSGVYPNGFGHAYFHNPVNALNGIIYIAHYSNKYLLRFNNTTSTWLTDTPSHVAPTQITFGNAVLPNLGAQGSVILFDGDFGPHRFDIATQAWTYYTWSSGIAGPYHVGGFYNSVADAAFIGGGNGSNAIWKIHGTTGVMTRLNDAPHTWGTNSGSEALNGSIVWVDPVSGHNMFFFPVPMNVGTLYRHNHVSDTWTQLSSSLNPPWATGSIDGPVFGTVCTSMPQHGVTFFVNWDGGNGVNSSVYLYKHNGT